MTVTDIITDALLEIGAIGPGEAVAPENLSFCLNKFNRMMDRFAARSVMAYNVSFALFTIQANHSPHSIGPGGDFNVTQRPVRIEAAVWILGAGATAIDAPLITIRDDDWWAANQVKGMTSSLATDLYYSPDWPLGSCYFWPVPSGAGQVRLELWGLLPTNKAAGNVITLPPGYWDMVVNNLALELCPGFEKSPNPVLMRNATQSLKAVEGNNDGSPRMRTAEPGQTSRGRGRSSDFNWADGSVK